MSLPKLFTQFHVNWLQHLRNYTDSPKFILHLAYLDMMAFFLSKDDNPMELVPDFLNALMDTMLMVQVHTLRPLVPLYDMFLALGNDVITHRRKPCARSIASTRRPADWPFLF